MLTTGEALEAVLRSLPTLPTVRAELERCTARALRQTVIAERDQPPFDRVTMDGIAVEHASFAGGQRRFPLQSLQAAGDPALTLEAGNAIEIMTGAALPSGADCIVPVERIEIRDGTATIEHGYVAEARQFIHPRASDHKGGLGRGLYSVREIVAAHDGTITVASDAGEVTFTMRLPRRASHGLEIT